MGKYNYVDREFFGESKNAAELITNTVYRRRLFVASEDLTNISVKCKSAKAKSTPGHKRNHLGESE